MSIARHASAAPVAIGVLVFVLIGCAADATPAMPIDAQPSVTATRVEPSVTAVPSVSPELAEVDDKRESTSPSGDIAWVFEVVDGDTIRVRVGGSELTVRYIGIDTPETKHPSVGMECYGKEATTANERLVGGRTVVLEKDISETDRYGRLLRYVWLDGEMVNEWLVREGYAVVSTYPPDVKYQERLMAAQRTARRQSKGLWMACDGADTPAETAPTAPASWAQRCDAAYPVVCIPPPPPDLDCGEIPYRRFRVVPPDPHRFDADKDGIGCES